MLEKVGDSNRHTAEMTQLAYSPHTFQKHMLQRDVQCICIHHGIDPCIGDARDALPFDGLERLRILFEQIVAMALDELRYERVFESATPFST